MRWALSKTRGNKPTYVGVLEPHENGMASNCTCAACGEPLQAINASKNEEHFRKKNTKWKFFRHPSGHESASCTFQAAKLAALSLFRERGEIDLPAPRRTSPYEGVSGTVYFGQSEGERWRGRILSTAWNDTQSATISLNGKTILVLLEARPLTSLTDKYDGVITIHVNDPVIASWAPEDILAALRLNDDKIACTWDRHWDDDLLRAAADDSAKSLAENAMDLMLPELGDLEGLTVAQKSETVLHALVKRILEASGTLRAPACREEVSQVMPNGGAERRAVSINSQQLKLSNVRLEQRMPGMVPDVLCTATSSQNPSRSFTLLIEVAVTHRVDASKRAKIIAAKLPCIEIDLSLFHEAGRRISLKQLEQGVLHRTDGKHWVFNAELADLVEEAKETLVRRASAIQQAIDQEDELNDWLDHRSDAGILELLLPVRLHHWNNSGAFETYDGYSVDLNDVLRQLIRRGFPHASEELLLKPRGLLTSLENIVYCHERSMSPGQYSGLGWIANDPALQSYIMLGFHAVKAYPCKFLPEDKAWLKAWRQIVWDSLQRGEQRFARPIKHDALVAALFPAMKELLKDPVGTREGLIAKKRALEAKSREEALERERVEAKRQQDADRAYRAQRVELQKKEEETRQALRDVDALLDVEGCRGIWTQNNSTDTVEELLKKTEMVRLADKYARSGLDVPGLLRSAFGEKGRHSFHGWFITQGAADLARAKMMLNALKQAGLVA